jgi:general secretion pathway protein A
MTTGDDTQQLKAWRGEFGTFWRVPPGWQPGAAGSAATRLWAEPQLRAALGAAPQGYAEQVAAFQLLHGLPVDGQTGPLTLMQLSRLAGVPEPRTDHAEATAELALDMREYMRAYRTVYVNARRK